MFVGVAVLLLIWWGDCVQGVLKVLFDKLSCVVVSRAGCSQYYDCMYGVRINCLRNAMV